MIMKESFRMQNHLKDLIHQAREFLTVADHVTVIRKEHLRSRSNPEAQDETEMLPRKHEMEANTVIGLLMDLLSEQERLTAAISRAKAAADLDIDAAIAMNKSRKNVIDHFKVLADLRASSVIDETGKGYLINVEGNPVHYTYPVKTIRTIDFDRTMVRGLIRRLQKESDQISTQIDLLNLTLEVDFEPKYDLMDSLEDAYERFAGSES